MIANWTLPERFIYRGHAIAWGTLGEGQAAVLLHGSPFSSLVWRRIAPWLARHRRVFYYDLVGFGQSDKPDTDVLHGLQNGLFAALVKHWGIERPDVVAHDFGGSAALRAHLMDGIDYSSLMLIDPVAISPQGSALVQAAKTHQDVFAGLPAYIHEAVLRAYIGAAAKHKLREEEMRLYLQPWLSEEGKKAFWRQVAQMDDKYSEEVEDRYGEIRCPVSILWGAEDEFIPLKDGEELARRIPNAPFIVVPDAKHLVQEDAPEAITAAVLDFWHRDGARHDAARTPPFSEPRRTARAGPQAGANR
ncbi:MULTISPECIES: alpha/beta hydrolase [unclassified Mesorhizobium]|uniref:alpha/beta fold hydrolase n=1 Tax=unclassified Mesorhizobium TaxID=325217 RepID=UPI0011294476|nr:MULTISPECIES: alpha/beta hydrolase [unclassified Mesorhizobium]MBZ9984647.1 alpha/beta hydrolase [Mesorhizobium sp. BR-1-1-8]TPL28813.1 alpha/beta hydrolase [Mesorhizobium sp. B2-4-8]TPL63703.1 alpha/beta hydrolase [Mesorhizobium sp. B2-4-1]